MEAFQSCKYILYTNICSPGVLCVIFIAKEMSRPGTSLGPARGTGLLPTAVVRSEFIQGVLGLIGTSLYGMDSLMAAQNDLDHFLQIYNLTYCSIYT